MSGPRVLLCDFCGCELDAGAWDFPAGDIDFGGTYVGPASQAPIGGTTGSWLACDSCGALVNSANRTALAHRSADRLRTTEPLWLALMGGYAPAVMVMRERQDEFWAARRGAGQRIGPEQLAVLARGPATVREWRHG